MGCLGKDPPDPAKGYVAGIRADLESLPARRLIEALAILGERGDVAMPGGQTQVFDFTGLGEADYQRQYADQMLGQLLQMQRELGPEFVEQRLHELELADPEGAAMRRRLWGQIKEGVEGGPTARPDLEALQSRVIDDLERGSELSPDMRSKLSEGVLGGQVSRGNWLGGAPATEEARVLTGAGEAQAAQAQERAMQFLTGGLAPEDAAYREGQQNLANLGAFISGETPTAQFQQLTGAQNQIVPFETGGPLPGTNPNAGWEGVDYANQLFGLNQAAQAGQVNPWVAGLSGAFQGLNTWASFTGAGGGGGRVTTPQAVGAVRAAY